jgi:hypothetical protein
MAERINHDKTENEMRDDVIDLKVRHFKVQENGSIKNIDSRLST